jgi:pseudouridine kinase
VELTHAITTEEATGSYLAVLDEAGEMVSAVSDMRAMDGLSPAHLERAARELAAADMLVADCNVPVACLDWLCALAAPRLLIEPVSVRKAEKLLAFNRATPVFAMTPNAQQFDALAGGDLARLHALGFANIVVHKGSEGATASDGSTVTEIAPARASAIADVTGAGDAAVAGLVCGLVEGHTLAQSARLGQCAAAIKLSSAQSVAQGLDRDSLLRIAGFT